MIPHSIRLRHPWNEVPVSDAELKAYRRRFNRPTGLDAWESVTLEIDRVMFHGKVSLNGASLGAIRTGQLFTADITPLLRPANELLVEVDPRTASSELPTSSSIYIVDANEPPGSPIGEVRLVIRTVSSVGDD